MKNIRLILTALAMLITFSAFSAIPPKVFDAMKVGNSTELSKYFRTSGKELFREKLSEELHPSASRRKK